MLHQIVKSSDSHEATMVLWMTFRGSEHIISEKTKLQMEREFNSEYFMSLSRGNAGQVGLQTQTQADDLSTRKKKKKNNLKVELWRVSMHKK